MSDDGKVPSLPELIELFRSLGAPEPEEWARSQFREGIPQLARFCFLKAAWYGLVQDGDVSWIEREIEAYRTDPNEVGAGAGRALSRMLELGASTNDITDLTRAMQWQTLFRVCTIIDNRTDDYHNPWRPEEHWHLILHETCRSDEPDVGGLHESVLELDPTGREMRPRPER